MSLWFQPKPRSVLYCDFAGFRVPEMTKNRPVIVLRAHKRNRRLVYVIPLSTTPPVPPQPYHFHVARSPVTHAAPTQAWAKCDMVAVVSTERLTVGRGRSDRQTGRALRIPPMITEEEFERLRLCVAKAFGFGAGSYFYDAGMRETETAIDSP